MRRAEVNARTAAAAAMFAALLPACVETIQHGGVPSSWPDESSTGYQPSGTALTPYNGPARIDVAGTVIEGADIKECLQLAADNIVIKRSKLSAVGCALGAINILDKSGTGQGGYHGIQLEDLEVDAQSDESPVCAVAGGGYSARRLNVHGINCGFAFYWNDGILVESCYVHDLVGLSAKDARSNGNSHVVVQGNNFEDPIDSSSTIFLVGDYAPIDDFLIQGNLLNGGGTVLWAGSHSGKPYPVATNVRVISNRWGRKFHQFCGLYGPVGWFDSSGAGNVWSDNLWVDTLEPIPPQ